MMARFRISLMASAFIGLAAILGAGRPAEAAFQLVFAASVGDPVTIDDDVFSAPLTGDLDPGTPGSIVFANVKVGNNTFTVQGNAQAPPLESQSVPAGTLTLTQSTFTITSTGAGTLYIYLTANDLNLPANAGVLVSSIGASISNGATGGPSGPTYSFQSFFDPDNNLGGTSGLNVTQTTLQGPFTQGLAKASVVTAPISPTSSGPFSATNVLIFTATGANQSLSVTGTTQVVAVPEPANIAMASTAALLSLCALRRRARA